jgi:hypothetical protein
MQKIGKVIDFLRSYMADLEYTHGNDGIHSLNHFTSGTPYFDTEEEAEKYLADLNITIKLMEASI